MSNEKAQITIFIIVGIIIMAAFILIYSLYSINSKTMESEIDKSTVASLNTIPIQQYIESCLKEIGNNGAYFIALRGGYFNLPENFFNESPPTAFYIYNDEELIPTKEEIGIELSKYIDNQIKYCLDFSNLKVNYVKIDSSKSNSILGKDNIVINMDLPVTIKAGDSISKLNNFHISLNDDRLIKSLIVANNITKQIKNNPESLCLTCIFNVADKYDFDINIDSYEESIYLFQLIDKSGKYDYNKKYIFNFAISLKE